MIKALKRALLVACFAAPLAAQASLLGQTANCDFQPDAIWSCSPTTGTVTDPGIEFTLDRNDSGPWFSVDIGPTSLLLTLLGNPLASSLTMGASEVLTISGLSGISGASLNFTSAFSGFDASDVSFTANSITLVLNASTWLTGQLALIDILLADGLPNPGPGPGTPPEGGTVPEPGTLALLGFGLVGVVLTRSRRR